MTGSSWFGGRRAAAAATGVGLVLVAGSLSTAAHAAPAAGVGAVECPTAVPMTSVAAGMVGEGLTVVTGSEPQPFEVEVLGVMKNGIGAGRDLVLIKVSDLPGREVISQGGGIWAGMSGSPVYVGGRLLGAVSYGFTSSPSPIGGLTPAADMLDVLGLGGAQAARTEVTAPASHVALPTATRKAVAARTGAAAPQGSLSPLVTPMGMSGLSSKRLRVVQGQLDDAGRNVHVYAAGSGGSVSPQAVPAARPAAGGNFAAVLSSGDVTAFATGTTTAVCGDHAVAFGHPLDLTGPSSYGAADASSLAIIEDATFGSFKMADLGPSFGTVDQDRTSAIRADLTKTPAAADVVTKIRSADTQQTRTGSTEVFDPTSLADVTESAVFAGQDAVFDEWNDGRSRSSWTISGTRAGGRTFTVTRSNLWASQDDSTIDPAVDVASAADALINNDAEKVTIDKIEFGSTMATTFKQLHITRIGVSVNGGKYTNPKRLALEVGDKLKVRVSTAPYRSTVATMNTFAVTVPKKARGASGSLSAVGGMDLAQSSSDQDCSVSGACETGTEQSLNQVIASLTSAPKNNIIQAQLAFDTDDGDSSVAATKKVSRSLTVTGERDIAVTVRG